MAASWHPDPQSLNELYHLIINSKSTDNETRHQASEVFPEITPPQNQAGGIHLIVRL